MSPEQQAFEAEISNALVDLVAAIHDGKAPLEEIGSTLADLVTAIESRSDLSEVVSAIKSIRLESPVVVNVSPTPIQNYMPAPIVQIMDRTNPREYELTVSYDNHDRITSARLSPVLDRNP